MRRLALAGFSWLVSGCSCELALGANSGDASPVDAAAHLRTDECGNGIDDDENGRVDDGCYCVQGETQPCFTGAYPGRRTGTCRDGTQTCTPDFGVEFDDWGRYECAGETLPVSERCDGSDADCDGAVDEGCACEGETARVCGADFAISPCTSGVQFCRDGIWSSCEGVLAPRADVCGDSIDNDCDGLRDDFCGCVPQPERCSDGLDNDCDGMRDEEACVPPTDPRPDAGIDAGPLDCGAFSGPACTPVSVNVLDGLMSPAELAGANYAMVARGCEIGIAFTVLNRAHGTPWQTRRYFARYALDGTRLSRVVLPDVDVRGTTPNPLVLAHGPRGWAVLYSDAEDGPRPERLQLLDDRGVLIGGPIAIGPPDVSATLELFPGSVFWNGTSWTALYSRQPDPEAPAALYSVFVDADRGSATPGPAHVFVGSSIAGLGWSGDTLVVGTRSTAAPLYEAHRFDGAMAPRGASVAIDDDSWINSRWVWSGHDWVVGFVPPTTAPVSEVWLARFDEALAPSGGPAPLFAVDATSPIASATDSVHLSAVGEQWSVAYSAPIEPNDRIVAFGVGTAAASPVDLSSLGVMSFDPASFCCVHSYALVAPRKAVLRHDGSGVFLHLLCEPR